MEYNYEPPRCCFKLVPVQIICKITVLVDILLHLLICGFLLRLATQEIIFVPFGVAFLLLAILSGIFYIGIVKESDDLMIPMIVAKVITMLIVGLVALFAWIAFILAIFSLVHFESPIKGLPTVTYLGLQNTAMTICFTVLVLEGSILHIEYKYIKRRVDQKNTADDLSGFMNGSSTLKPTAV